MLVDARRQVAAVVGFPQLSFGGFGPVLEDFDHCREQCRVIVEQDVGRYLEREGDQDDVPFYVAVSVGSMSSVSRSSACSQNWSKVRVSPVCRR